MAAVEPLLDLGSLGALAYNDLLLAFTGLPWTIQVSGWLIWTRRLTSSRRSNKQHSDLLGGLGGTAASTKRLLLEGLDPRLEAVYEIAEALDFVFYETHCVGKVGGCWVERGNLWTAWPRSTCLTRGVGFEALSKAN